MGRRPLMAGLALVAVSCAPRREPEWISGGFGPLRREEREALVHARWMRLFHLDPEARQNAMRDARTDEDVRAALAEDRGFHGWPILESAEVRKPSARAEIGGIVARSTDADDAKIMMCFFPHHGMRVEAPNGDRVDFVICFACGSMTVLRGRMKSSVPISAAEAGRLDAAFLAAGIRR